MANKHVDDFTPVLNNFIKSSLAKGETANFAENLAVLTSLASDGTSITDALGPKDAIARPLGRLIQYGGIPISAVTPILKALSTPGDRDEKRLIHYLVQLALGDSSAGTPLPTAPSRATMTLPKAVDRFGPEVLAASWADLSDERSSLMRKQGALRALAALAHASLTSKPDDPTYVGGLFVTLQSLLDAIDSARGNRKGLEGLMSAHGKKKGSLVSDFRTRMEMWGLLRMAFSAARVALSKSGINKIAARSFAGINSTDSTCARHALALASLVAREPQGARLYASEVGPLLKNNVDMAKRTGFLFQGIKTHASPNAPPTVSREQPDNYLNLRDTWSRIYLARSCAALIQSGYIAGDIHGSGEVYWDALTFMATSDPSDLVAMEAIRAMFGAPYPRAEYTIRRRHPTPLDLDLEVAQSKIYGASWHMVMSVADEPPLTVTAVGPAGAVVAAADGSNSGLVPAGSSGPSLESMGSMVRSPTLGRADAADAPGSLFGRIAMRLLQALQSRSRAVVAAACKTVGMIFESHAWCIQLSGGAVLQTPAVHKSLGRLQSVLQSVLADEGLGATERCTAAEALLWMETGEQPHLLQPGLLLKAMAQGGFSVAHVVKALFADPWPEPLVHALLAALQRRMRATPALAEHLMDLVTAACAAAPSRVPREQLQQLLDAAPGPVAAAAALKLLGSPLPPITQPPSSASVEVKVLACHEESAFESLKCLAAWWLGEHVNHIAGDHVWKPAAPSLIDIPGPGLAEPSERMAVAAVVYSPLLSLVISHLQRALLSGPWELKSAAVHGLAKVAVRSREPYRIQCYSILAATQQPVGGAADPLGVAACVRPVLEVLDAMYTGELVVNNFVTTYGAAAASWPAPALQSVSRRHEWLQFLVAQRICFVPKDSYFPLGPKSKALLKPDEPVEQEEEEEEALQAAQKATPLQPTTSATLPADQEQYYDDQYYDEQYYNDQYYDGQYYGDYDGSAAGAGDGYYYGDQQADPLAQWQAGDYAEGAVAPKLQLRLAGDGDSSTHTYDDEDVRYGTVLYSFSAETEEEVSVSAGERIKVHLDMGDWLQVSTMSGKHGMVPASYVSIEEDVATPADSTRRGAPYGGTTSYGANDAYDTFGEASEAYTTSAYDRGYGDASAYSGYGYGEDSEAAAVPFGRRGGGLDEFGLALQATAQPPPAAPPQQQQAQGRLPRASSDASTASAAALSPVAAAAPRAMQQAAAAYVNAAVSNNPTISTTTSQQQQHEAVLPGAEDQAAAVSDAAMPAYSGGVGEDNAFGGRFGAVSSAYEAQSAQQEPATPPTARSASIAFSSEDRHVSLEQPLSPARGALVMYDFVAELENELTISAGEQLVIRGEVDGWLQATRVSDGQSGLIPAAYVQMTE